MNYTKGPWKLPHLANDEVECDCGYILADQYMGSICNISVDNGLSIGEGGNDCPPFDEAKANARLISAAPDLYEALKRIVTGDFESEDDYSYWREEALDALSKAEGK